MFHLPSEHLLKFLKDAERAITWEYTSTLQPKFNFCFLFFIPKHEEDNIIIKIAVYIFSSRAKLIFDSFGFRMAIPFHVTEIKLVFGLENVSQNG